MCVRHVDITVSVCLSLMSLSLCIKSIFQNVLPGGYIILDPPIALWPCNLHYFLQPLCIYVCVSLCRFTACMFVILNFCLFQHVTLRRSSRDTEKSLRRTRKEESWVWHIERSVSTETPSSPMPRSVSWLLWPQRNTRSCWLLINHSNDCRTLPKNVLINDPNLLRDVEHQKKKGKLIPLSKKA